MVNIEQKKYSKLHLNVDSELKKKFNIKCIENNTDMTTVINKFIELYINNKNA